MSLLVVLGLLATLAVLVWEVGRSKIHIDAFSVPSDLESQGVSGQYVARRLVDHMSEISATAQTSLRRHPVSTTADEVFEGVAVPGTEFSALKAIRYVRDVFGMHAPRVSGHIVRDEDDGTLSLIVRVKGRSSNVREFEIEKVRSGAHFLRAARWVYRHTQPFVLASYLYRVDPASVPEAIQFVLDTPPPTDDARAHSLRGLMSFDSGRYEEAIESYDIAIELEPKALYAWFNRGNALMKLGRYTEARQAFERVLAIDDENACALYQYALALDELGREEDAEQMFERVVEAESRESEPCPVVMAYVRLGRPEEAIRSTLRAIERQPEQAWPWYIYGQLLLDLGRYDEAIAKLEQAVQLDAEDADSWALYGNAQVRLGRFTESLDQYGRALSLDDRNETALIGSGAALLELGRNHEAVSVLSRALLFEPMEDRAWHNLGIALRRTGRLAEAVEAHERSVSLNPVEGDFWNSYGNTLRELRRYKDALAKYRRALEVAPELPEAWYSYGTALEELGRHEEALESYRRAMSIDRGHRPAEARVRALMERRGQVAPE